MARILSMRALLEIRNFTVVVRHPCHSPAVSSKKNNSLFTPTLPFFSFRTSTFPYIEDRPITIYHPGVELLKSCHSSKHIFQVHAQLITCGLFPFWSSRLMKYSIDFIDIDYTLLVFRCIDSPGTFCVNNVIKAYSGTFVAHRAVVFYFEMLKNGFFPNSYTFVSLIRSCAKMGCVESGRKCHGQAVKNGADSVLQVQNSLIHLYGCCGVVSLAKKVFDEMSQRDLVSWNSIVYVYTNVGALALAHELFDMLHERNVVSWNIMISGYMKGNNPGCALMVFRKMVHSGLRGNDTTMVCALSACGRSARLKEGRSVHGFLIRTFVKLSIILETSLIDMYSKCQKVEVAREIFNRMVNRNLVCWNAMILGHCIHGNIHDGLDLFADMVDWTGLGCGKAVMPDEVTYIGILCACARAGLLTEGRGFFSQMIHKYNIKPNFAHYWCMANLYVGAGLIQEAEDMLLNMPWENGDVSSESLVWANLLSFSRLQASTTLGERIAKCLMEKEPWNFSHHQLLLNVYAAAGQWDGVSRVKEMVKERRMRRMPGCRLVDLKEIVHNDQVGHCWAELMGEIGPGL